MADSRPSSLFAVRDNLTLKESWCICKNAINGSSGAQPVSNGMMDFSALTRWMFLLWGGLCVLMSRKSFFQTVSSSTSEETPTWPGGRHQIYRHAFPLMPTLPLKYQWRWSFFFFFSFLNISHFLSSRPFLCFRFSHYSAAVMFLCSSTTLPPQKLIVWNYAVGCKSLLVYCNWLLLHWQWQLFLLSFTRHAFC